MCVGGGGLIKILYCLSTVPLSLYTIWFHNNMYIIYPHFTVRILSLTQCAVHIKSDAIYVHFRIAQQHWLPLHSRITWWSPCLYLWLIPSKPNFQNSNQELGWRKKSNLLWIQEEVCFSPNLLRCSINFYTGGLRCSINFYTEGWHY